MATTKSKTKPLTCAVLSRPACCCTLLPFGQAGELEINADRYSVEFNAELAEDGTPLVYGYRLTKLADDGNTYDLPFDLAACECMGFLRHGHCRHQTALRHLRQAGEI